MPECRYGKACKFKSSCIYSHSAASNSTNNVCMAYIAGHCDFGKNCFNQHPDKDTVAKLKLNLKTKPCMYGVNCQTKESCLYSHPEITLNPKAKEFVPSFLKEKIDYNFQTPIYPLKKSSTTSAQRTNYKRKKVRIPQDMWVNNFERSSAVAMTIKDPLDRFLFVNRHFESNQEFKIMDLHYQSLSSYEIVLSTILPKVKKGEKVWIITGSGHHATDGHQKKSVQKGGLNLGVLYTAVETWLDDHFYTFDIGVDVNGHPSAFVVYV
eukprot:augustus_masked-scaffold_4-processed-gene-8.53-mRNA-1 protein AED:0.96 eAED:1.00 QI:0/-1/0/1/-1/1/1/0/265